MAGPAEAVEVAEVAAEEEVEAEAEVAVAVAEAEVEVAEVEVEAEAEVEAEVEVEEEEEAEAEEEIRHEKAPDSRDGRSRPGEPTCSRTASALCLRAAAAEPIARAGPPGRMHNDPRWRSLSVRGESWAAVRKAPPPPAGRPRPPELSGGSSAARQR